METHKESRHNGTDTSIAIVPFHIATVKQVAEGLRRFGISAKSTSTIVVRIGPKLSDVEKKALQVEMQGLTGGKLASLDDLPKTADVKALQKVSQMYKQRNVILD